MFIFPFQLTTSRIGSLTRLILTLAICEDHTYIQGPGLLGGGNVGMKAMQDLPRCILRLNCRDRDHWLVGIKTSVLDVATTAHVWVSIKRAQGVSHIFGNRLQPKTRLDTTKTVTRQYCPNTPKYELSRTYQRTV